MFDFSIGLLRVGEAALHGVRVASVGNPCADLSVGTEELRQRLSAFVAAASGLLSACSSCVTSSFGAALAFLEGHPSFVDPVLCVDDARGRALFVWNPDTFSLSSSVVLADHELRFQLPG